LRFAAQKRVLGDEWVQDEKGSTPPAGENVTNGYSLGVFIPVENEQSLTHFHTELERLATGSKRRLRILAYGASHTQGDLYTGYLRAYLQSRFGNGGQGFMQMVAMNPWYQTLDHRVKSNGFRVQYAQKKVPEPEGIFGLLGAAAVGYSQYALASVFPKNESDPALTASSYELFFFAQNDGGDFTLSVDSEPRARVSARGPNEARYHTLQLANGWHHLTVRPGGNGNVRLFGVSIERDEPGLVIDTLGLNGTRQANVLSWNQELWTEHLRRRAPDLVLFAYGTNEALDTRQPIGAYRKDLKEVLTRFRRALPEASCVLVGPGDFPSAVPGGYSPRPRLVEVKEVQREVAPTFNCGFFDTYKFMGGEGAMQRWVNASPPMAAPDHIHLRPRGYVKLGMTLGDALLRAYDEFHVRH
jgi:lysophospholipase L1-like esterase